MVAIENDRPYPRELIAEVTPVSSLERTPVNNRASFVVFTAPSFASMDEPSEWSVVPSGQLQSNNNATSGEFSLTNPQCGWFALVSPLFDAAEWEMVGSKLAIDVYVPTNVSNPQWVGDVQMRLKSAASGVHDAYLGYHSLTTLPRGAWSTLEFSLTPTAFQLIDLDRPSIRLQIDVNNGVCNGGLLLDNLRLTGI